MNFLKKLQVNSVTSLFSYFYFYFCPKTETNSDQLELSNSETSYKAVLIDIYREN